MSAGLAALRAAMEAQREREEPDGSVKERLQRILARDGTGRDGADRGGQGRDADPKESVRERLGRALEREDGLDVGREAGSLQERLSKTLGRAGKEREREAGGKDREQGEDEGQTRGRGHGRGEGGYGL